MDSIRRERSNFFFSYNMIFDQPVSEHAKIVYLCLCRFSDSDARAFPSLNLIGEKSGIKRTTVKNALKELMRIGLLDVVIQHTSKGGQTANLYIVYNEPNEDVAQKYAAAGSDQGEGSPHGRGESLPYNQGEGLPHDQGRGRHTTGEGSPHDRGRGRHTTGEGSPRDPKGIPKEGLPVLRTSSSYPLSREKAGAAMQEEEEDDGRAGQKNKDVKRKAFSQRPTGELCDTASPVPGNNGTASRRRSGSVQKPNGCRNGMGGFQRPHIAVPARKEKTGCGDADAIDGVLSDPMALEAVAAYNELCPSLPRVSGLTTNRVISVRALLAQFGGKLDKLRELFRKAEECAFLRGENDHHWRAGFDWLMEPEHVIKVMEDFYWDKSSSTLLAANASEGGPSYDIDEYVKLSLRRLNESAEA